eukprot:g32761.t1
MRDSAQNCHRSAEYNRASHGISTIDGQIDSYDASGYSVDYRMSVSDPDSHITGQYRADMEFLRSEGWIGPATRVVIISFSTYNTDYDLWTASDFMWEIPADGHLLATYSTKPFKPRTYETRAFAACSRPCQKVRLAIAIYILIFVGWSERQHKVRNHKAGFYYHISLSGITDMGLVICVFVTLVWRTDPGIADGLSHTVYLQWKAIGQALKAFMFFTLIFVPAIAGFIVVSTALFGKYIFGFSSLSRTTVSTFKLTAGDLHPSVLDRDVVVGVISTIALYLLLTFFLMNVFITIFVDAYYVVRLTCTQPAEKWDGQRIRTWALPGACVSMFQAVWPSMPPQAKCEVARRAVEAEVATLGEVAQASTTDEKPRPLQLVQIDLEKNKVRLNEEDLAVLEKSLENTGVEKVAIIAVMGAFRTGKSFLLDLML